MDRELFLPTLAHWKFENNWSGSCGALRFFVTTSEESMLAEVWNEDVCRELAQIRDSAQFEVSQEGLDAMRAWLEEQYCQLG